MLEAMPVKKLAAGGRPIVRVLPQPLYDTEFLKAATATSQVTFYAKPLGNPDASGVIGSKTLQATNLRQSGSLAKPYEFDLFSFNLKIVGSGATSATLADLARVTQEGYLEFQLGNRTYLDVPLKDMPCGVAVDGFDPANATVHLGVAHRSNAWKFTVGKYLVHIRSTESCSVTLNWQSAVTCAANTQLVMFMNGLLYNAI
jgi:hypothetical protein